MIPAGTKGEETGQESVKQERGCLRQSAARMRWRKAHGASTDMGSVDEGRGASRYTLALSTRVLV